MSRTSSSLRLAALLSLSLGVMAPALASAGPSLQGPSRLPPPVQPRPVPGIAQVPDLVIQESPTYRPIDEAGHALTVEVRATVRNRGLGATTGPFGVRATVSLIAPDADLPYRIFPVYTQRVTRGIASGASIDLTLGTPLSIVAPRGTTVLVEYEVDYRHEVAELSETNNRHSQRIVVR